MHLPSRVGIVGLGLMGGSLAQALRTLPAPPHVAAFSLDGTDLEAALRDGSVDEIHADPDPVARDRDLVLYAVPLDAALELLDRHHGLWGRKAVVTDVVSLKEPLLERARSLGVLERFVGSHPLTGGEGSGYAEAQADLYRDATVWLAGDGASDRAVSMVRGLWEAVGARPRRIEAREHDLRMVRASHLPQLLSNLLAEALGRAGIVRDDLGPGGRDMTRLAGSSPEMWRSLFRHSGAELADALEDVAESAREVAEALEAEELDRVVRLMERSREWLREADPGEDSWS